MTFYLLAYAFALFVFVILDAIWLGSTGSLIYKPVLGDILVDNLRIAPVIFYYLMYPLGVVVFAIAPALKADSVSPALIYGALFGLFAYATYDLTNHATLRNWTAQITIIDIAWGTFASGATAALAYLATQGVASYFNLTTR